MELHSLSISQLRERITSREITVTEYVQSTLARTEQFEDSLNSYVTISKAEALQAARQIDKKIVQGQELGLLSGGTLAVKDNICTKSVRTTCSSKMLENFVPPYNATVIDLVQSQDGVLIGKANMDEFAMGSSTESSYFGPTRNPWDMSRVPGGSSGGSAAAVAAGEALVSLGADTGGSVRCPASFCGVVGLKPTYGLVSRYGLISYGNSLEQIGPMASNVEDCAILLSVIARHDARDSTSFDRPPQNYAKGLAEGVSGIRVGIPREFLGEGTADVVSKEFYSAISVLESLGVECQEISFPSLGYALPAYYLLAMSEASSNLARYDGLRYGFHSGFEGDWNEAFSRTRNRGFGAEVRRRIILGTYALSAGYFDKFFLKAAKVANLVKREFRRALEQFDLLAGPTMPFPAFKLGEKINDPLSLYLSDVDTVPINLAGLPAISLTCSVQNGLPIGMQLIASPFQEDLLLRTAFALEKKFNITQRPQL